ERRRSRIVFGTIDLPDSPIATTLLDRFYAAGGRLLDLAIVYREGEAQRAVPGPIPRTSTPTASPALGIGQARDEVGPCGRSAFFRVRAPSNRRPGGEAVQPLGRHRRVRRPAGACFELGGECEQEVISAGRPDELHADRDTVAGLV